MKREVTITEKMPDKSRKGIYRISDPFLATWFAFVHPFRDSLDRGDRAGVIDKIILPKVREYLPRAVEPVVLEMFRSQPLSDLLSFEPASAGRFWSPDSEIDLVVFDEHRRNAFIGELKWTRSPADPRELATLRKKVANEKAFDGVRCTFGMVSRSGFTGKPRPGKDELFVDLSALKLGS